MAAIRKNNNLIEPISLPFFDITLLDDVDYLMFFDQLPPMNLVIIDYINAGAFSMALFASPFKSPLTAAPV